MYDAYLASKLSRSAVVYLFACILSGQCVIRLTRQEFMVRTGLSKNVLDQVRAELVAKGLIRVGRDAEGSYVELLHPDTYTVNVTEVFVPQPLIAPNPPTILLTRETPLLERCEQANEARDVSRKLSLVCEAFGESFGDAQKEYPLTRKQAMEWLRIAQGDAVRVYEVVQEASKHKPNYPRQYIEAILRREADSVPLKVKSGEVTSTEPTPMTDKEVDALRKLQERMNANRH